MTNSLRYFSTHKNAINANVHLTNSFVIPISYEQFNYVSLLSYKNVLYIPIFRFNLLFGNRLIDFLNIYLISYNNSLFLQEIKKWKMIDLARKNSGLYYLVQKSSSRIVYNSTVFSTSVKTTIRHYRLGHSNFQYLKSCFLHYSIISISSFSNGKYINYPNMWETTIQSKGTKHLTLLQSFTMIYGDPLESKTF